MKQKDGAQCLAEGKNIKNLTHKNWEEAEDEAMKRANRYKYEQNPDLKAMLMATKDSTLAEASPHCKRWGIGVPLSNAGKENTQLWGNNKFGQALMTLRKEFAEEPAQPMQ
jgi:hypothetical protein